MFITIEGCDGAGKSTAIGVARDYLSRRGLEIEATREPGGSVLAERIRTLFLSRHTEPVAPLTELLLICAGRAQHLERRIMPALSAGRWVLCDRFVDATYAYQGGGRGLDESMITTLSQMVHPLLCPDLTLLLDVTPARAMRRRASAYGQEVQADLWGGVDRMERENIAFVERVRHTYLQRAAAEPKRFRVLDANLPEDEVAHLLVQELAAFCDQVTGA